MKLLQGIRVLELGGFITAPLGAMLLGEYGADVIKVERPGAGDPFRAFLGGSYSPHFQAHNRNKRSVALDYSQPAGLKLLRQLVRTADVFIVNTRPGVAEKLGVSASDMRAANPKLIYCSITGFGADGPYAGRPAFDNVGQALSGWMSRHRTGDDPRVAGPAISDPATSLYAAIGILAALYERERSGAGRVVEVNMLEATMALNIEAIAFCSQLGRPTPVYHRGALSQAYNLVCADGKRIGLHLSSPDKFWAGLCRAVQRPDLLERYPKRQDRVQGYDAIAQELRAAFSRRPRDEWMAILEKEDVPFAPERGVDELAEDAQVRHLGSFQEVLHPKRGKTVALRRPVLIDGDREIDPLAPPELGEHTLDVLRDLGIAESELASLSAAGVLGAS